jgi:DNA-directed RNA polymerase subunit H (RpoH/RPB5)
MSKCIEILQKRGYTIANKDNDNMILMNDRDNKLVIIFICEDNLAISELKLYIKIIKENNIEHAIIIYKNKITPTSKKIIDQIDLLIELFTYEQMSINIFKHKYYFPHIKIEGEELKEITNKYGIKLPIILKTDSIVKYLGFKKGDILKIIRKNDYIHYRIVK